MLFSITADSVSFDNSKESRVFSTVRSCIRSTCIVCVLLVLASGCVRRRLVVRTNPPGASAFVDKQYIGTTPAATSTTYYGTREIEVVKDGYQTTSVLRTIRPPWYQIPPLDFFSETLWPWELRDERIIDISMPPEQLLSDKQLQANANTLRTQSVQGLATPLPPSNFVPGEGSTDLPILPPQQAYPQQLAPPPRRPGQLLRDFFQPGGQPPQRIPEAGILPGGGYRPEVNN